MIDNILYTYRFDVAGCIISLAVILCFFNRRNVSTRTITSFLALVTCNFLAGLLDTLTIVFQQHNDIFPSWSLYFVNLLFLMVYNTTPIIFFYNMYLTAEDDKLPSKRFSFFVNLPYQIAMAGIITSFMTKWIFTITDENEYQRGPLMPVLFAIAFCYIIAAMIFFIKKRTRFSRNQKITILLYTFISLTSSMLSLFISGLYISCFCLSISIFIIYLSLENPAKYMNPETGTLNRLALIADLKKRTTHKTPFKLIGLHVAELKYLNKTIGYENRTLITKQITSFLIETFGRKNVFQLSENIFALLFDFGDPVTQFSQIETIRSRFNEVFSTNNDKNPVEVSLSALLTSIHYPDDAVDIDDLLDLLDNSFEDIRETERNRLERADLVLLEKRKRNQKILSLLHDAIENDGFTMVYQPIYSVQDKKFVGAEALLRFKEIDDEIGYIGPEEFIPIAEKNGLLMKLGSLVFHKVCKFVKESKISDYDIRKIHINLSVIQCMQENLHEELCRIIDTYNLDYTKIGLEISEGSTMLASQETLNNNISQLREHNIDFFLDDYGTGYSNTSTLLKYPFSIIKLDRSMIWDAMNDEKSKAILKQTIAMIKDLDMLVIAEGAETKEQTDVLIEMGCDFIQGFYYSKPITSQEFVSLLTDSAHYTV